MPATADLLQQHQPDGVPPLTLTGERTLPDLPAENYWFSRHLAAYQWIARRCSGLEVVDLACGEGYGCAVLAERAATVVGVDANPEAHRHARLKYRRAGVDFACELVERFEAECDAVVFLQTIEHVAAPDEMLDHLRSLLRPGGVAYVSTPNVLTLAPAGAARSDNPWHLREYRPDEFRALCGQTFEHVELLGLFHARRLWLHDAALARRWDRCLDVLRLREPFYRRFTPALSARDFKLREGPIERSLDLLAILR